jgi:gliding motility-associated-like protein
MKKLITLISCICLCALFIKSNAQFIVNNPQGYVKLTDQQYNLDALILLNGIDGSTTINYTGSESIEWRYTIGGENYNSTQPEIIPESDILYTVYINGIAQHHIYVIDYTQYLSQLNSLEVTEGENKCQQITLNADFLIPEIKYIDRTNSTQTLAREFTLSYDNAAWRDSAWVDITTDTVIQLSTSNAQFSIPAPYKSTTFSLHGDQWAEQLGITTDSIMTDYTAIAVKCYPRGKVVEREYLNEKDRSNDPEIKGSAPLVVEFESRANPLDIIYYEWFVYNVETPNAYQRYNDTDLRYTFDKTGEYKVKLIATSNTCEYIDSLDVRVLESYLEAPNVFTPNGDGINDEWRVAYKSIESYQCIIQNRWGRTVFKSTDPGKGWDGTIGGRPAAEGTYYYVIVAYGTDKFPENHKKAGKQMKYKLSGDINLFR